MYPRSNLSILLHFPRDLQSGRTELVNDSAVLAQGSFQRLEMEVGHGHGVVCDEYTNAPDLWHIHQELIYPLYLGDSSLIECLSAISTSAPC